MVKTITVDKLIEGYSSLTSDKVKEEYINRNVKIIDYIDASVLDVIGTSIINASSFDKDGLINIDSFKRYILTVFAYIDNCTNIELDAKNWTIHYDRLKQIGLLNQIIAIIPKEIISDIDTIIHMKYDDLIINYQMKRYDKISYIPESLIMGISEILKKSNELLKNINWDELLRQNNNIISD